MPHNHPTELNLRLLKAFGIEPADGVLHVTLELRPMEFPSLVVKRMLTHGGVVWERLETRQLRAVADDDGMGAVSVPVPPASMSTRGGI